MPLKSDDEGCYTATWVPAATGTYLIQVFIDNKHTGKPTLSHIIMIYAKVSLLCQVELI